MNETTPQGEAEEIQYRRGCLVSWAIAVGLFITMFVIALPSMIKGRTSADEIVATIALRELYQAQKQYHNRFGAYGSLEDLHCIDTPNPQLMERIMGAKTSGYFYKYKFDEQSWHVVAWPDVGSGTRAKKSFYVDQTGTLRWVRFKKKGDPPAGPDSPKLRQF